MSWLVYLILLFLIIKLFPASLMIALCIFFYWLFTSIDGYGKVNGGSGRLNRRR